MSKKGRKKEKAKNATKDITILEVTKDEEEDAVMFYLDMHPDLGDPIEQLGKIFPFQPGFLGNFLWILQDAVIGCHFKPK